MKKSQLKHVIKPIVKQCLNELLIEQGLLSNIISEVIKGVQPIQQPLVAADQQKLLQQQRIELQEQRQQMMKENKRKLLDAAGFNVDVFKGTSPIQETSDPSNGKASALSGVDASDPGVNIDGIVAIANRDWSKMI